MRGSGRPAFCAAARITGTMWVSSVEVPVIHVIVPSAKRPAKPNITGPRAATTSGTVPAPATDRPTFTR